MPPVGATSEKPNADKYKCSKGRGASSNPTSFTAPTPLDAPVDSGIVHGKMPTFASPRVRSRVGHCLKHGRHHRDRSYSCPDLSAVGPACLSDKKLISEVRLEWGPL